MQSPHLDSIPPAFVVGLELISKTLLTVCFQCAFPTWERSASPGATPTLSLWLVLGTFYSAGKCPSPPGGQGETGRHKGQVHSITTQSMDQWKVPWKMLRPIVGMGFIIEKVNLIWAVM